MSLRASNVWVEGRQAVGLQSGDKSRLMDLRSRMRYLSLRSPMSQRGAKEVKPLRSSESRVLPCRAHGSSERPGSPARGRERSARLPRSPREAGLHAAT